MNAIRVILCMVGDKPRVTWIHADPSDGHVAALGMLLGVPVARIPLHDGVELCCDRDGLLFGLALVRRALATSPTTWPPPEVVTSPDGRSLSLLTGNAGPRRPSTPPPETCGLTAGRRQDVRRYGS